MTPFKLAAGLCGLWLIALGSPVHADDEQQECDGDAHEAEPGEDTDTAIGTGPPSCTEPARRPLGRFEVGAGVSTDEGLIFGAGIVQPDLFRSGHSLALTARLSRLREDFLVRYGAPSLLGTGLDLQADAFSSAWIMPGYTRHGVGGRVTLSRAFSSTTRGYVGYRLEDTRVDLPTNALLRAQSASAPGTLLRDGLVSSLRAGIIYDTRDGAAVARRGTYAEVYGEVADARLGSEIDFDRVGAMFRHSEPVGPLTLRFSGRIEGIVSAGAMVPLSERLHLDGHADVRGFGFGTVEPWVDIDGHSVAAGGNVLATGRAELEFPLIPRWGIYGAVFYDAGTVSSLDGFGRHGTEFAHSVGVSLIWRSPVGALQFDFALPLNARDDGDRLQTLFSLGGTM